MIVHCTLCSRAELEKIKLIIRYLSLVTLNAHSAHSFNIYSTWRNPRRQSGVWLVFLCPRAIHLHYLQFWAIVEALHLACRSPCLQGQIDLTFETLKGRYCVYWHDPRGWLALQALAASSFVSPGAVVTSTDDNRPPRKACQSAVCASLVSGLDGSPVLELVGQSQIQNQTLEMHWLGSVPMHDFSAILSANTDCCKNVSTNAGTV